eukprot:TRINITY_DN19044_c0_g1_i2.p1 TRINITY_DN19044_c0_g1~~TRINITY_DN19044_c0_g1_i2.p1  ORF type:complete len:529 (+),score=180.83 TRINITY_DN19044_c0_g1_i2:56-1588(+)
MDTPAASGPTAASPSPPPPPHAPQSCLPGPSRARSAAVRLSSAALAAPLFPGGEVPMPVSSPTSPAEAAGERERQHLHNFGWLLGNETLSDVTIESKSGGVIPAHRCVLATHSPTFRTMFEQSWQENRLSRITVQYSHEACMCVLRFMYCCDVGIDHSLALEVLDAAIFYDLPSLRRATVLSLKASTSRATVFSYLRCALLYEECSLKEHCIAFVRQSNAMWDTLPSADLYDIPGDVLMLLVEEAVIESDLYILQRLHAWCVEQVKRGAEESASELLQGFLRFIDFTSMNKDELAEIEEAHLVPVSVLYSAFKNKVLGIEDDAKVQRRGAIPLHWDCSQQAVDAAPDSENGLRTGGCADGWERFIAQNKFTKGKHYWTYTVHDFKEGRACLVGVCQQRPPHTDAQLIVYEPFCNTVHAAGTKTKKSELHAATIDWFEIGILINFDEGEVNFYNHTTKEELWTVTSRPLPTPLYPFAAMVWSRHGLSMSETTTYPTELREKPPPHGPTSPS